MAFQFTRPRGARLLALDGDGVLEVSIHAPTRGATSAKWKAYANICVSIHAPTRGATIIAAVMPSIKTLFQFTRPRGARHCKRHPQGERERFQFTRPRGARRIFLCQCPERQPFQFTRPRGARLAVLPESRQVTCFNSRAHAGRDDKVRDYLIKVKVSIHAPTRGATLGVLSGFPALTVSIHAPTRGATGEIGDQAGGRIVSIHAPTRGATYCHPLCLNAIVAFQFTRPRGARLVRPVAEHGREYVSIHAPTRGATRGSISILSAMSVSIHAPTRGATSPR